MSLDIYSVADRKPTINLLVYSDAGVGKTSFAASAARHPDMKGVLFANIEGGLLSIAGVEGCGAVDIKSMEQLEELHWSLVNEKVPGVHTLVVDSGSELQNIDLANIVQTEWDKEKDKKEDKRKRTGPDDIWQKDYGKNTNRIKRILRWLRDAPYHTIITAHPKRVYERLPEGSTRTPELIEVVPFFTEKLGISVRGYADFVWYMYQEEETEEVEEGQEPPEPKLVRKLLTRDAGAYKAKTRGHQFSKALGRVVTLADSSETPTRERPDLATIYDMLLESEGFKGTKK